MYKDLMVDLETLGTSPGCVVLSIGAVAFDSNGVSDNKFYVEINIGSSQAGGQLFVDPKTLEWWNSQAEDAKALLARCETGGVPLGKALLMFSRFIYTECEKDFHIWGNGASFDEPIISEVFKSIGMTPPWKYYNSRCYRTLKGLGAISVKEPEFKGVKHNALNDAVHQAEYALMVMNHFGMWGK